MRRLRSLESCSETQVLVHIYIVWETLSILQWFYNAQKNIDIAFSASIKASTHECDTWMYSANTVSSLLTFSCNRHAVNSTKRAKIAHFIERPTRQHDSGSWHFYHGSTPGYYLWNTTSTVYPSEHCRLRLVNAKLGHMRTGICDVKAVVHACKCGPLT